MGSFDQGVKLDPGMEETCGKDNSPESPRLLPGPDGHGEQAGPEPLEQE